MTPIADPALVAGLDRAADGDLAELGQPGLGFAGRDLHAGPGQREAVRGGADQEYRYPDRGRVGAGDRGRDYHRDDRDGDAGQAGEGAAEGVGPVSLGGLAHGTAGSP